MARTWRNRHVVPKGFKVRDGKPAEAYDSRNKPHYFGSNSHIVLDYKKFTINLWTPGRFLQPTALQSWQIAYFANRHVLFEYRYLRKFRRSIFSKETINFRKFYRSSQRVKVRQKMAQGRWDDIPREKKTCGWNSW